MNPTHDMILIKMFVDADLFHHCGCHSEYDTDELENLLKGVHGSEFDNLYTDAKLNYLN